MNFSVKGLRVEHVLTYNDREEAHEENTRWVLLLEEETKWNNGDKFELSLHTEYGDCYSGYCAASYGRGSIKQVKDFVGITHKPNKELSLSLNIEKEKCPCDIPDIDCEIFSCSYDDGDCYYASGGCSVNMELFTPTPRVKSGRPVWIFKGASNLGKSYLSHLISNADVKEIYETDSNMNLPDSITADIVVLGNKYTFTEKEIKSKLCGNNNEVIMVNFSL